MARKPKPSFFKVLLNDFTLRLPLPPRFVKNHGEILPENVTLKINGGKPWDVKLEQDEGVLYFTQGWVKIVEDLDLKMWTFLVFRLVSNSIVNVVPYGLSACEMEFEDWESQTDDSEPEEVPFNDLPAGKQSVCYDKLEGSAETTNPNFFVTLKEHHRYRLTLYEEFATETGLAYKKAVVLEDPHGRYWHVALRCRRGCSRLEMTTGCSELQKANGLAIGDTCWFEFIPIKNVIRFEYLYAPV